MGDDDHLPGPAGEAHSHTKELQLGGLEPFVRMRCIALLCTELHCFAFFCFVLFSLPFSLHLLLGPLAPVARDAAKHKVSEKHSPLGAERHDNADLQRAKHTHTTRAQSIA